MEDKNEPAFSVRNLTRYQHYRDRNPVWVKLYQDFLSDPDLQKLTPGARFFAASTVLLASRYSNRIRLDTVWLWHQIGTQQPGIIVEWVRELASIGYIELNESASKMLQMPEKCASAERERETEREAEAEREGEAERETYTHTPSPSARRVRGKYNGYPQEFLDFWDAYPRKSAKGDAFKAWSSLRPDKETQGAMGVALETQTASADWHKDNGKWIPFPATWLRGRRWEDVPLPQMDDGLSELDRKNIAHANAWLNQKGD